MTIQASPEVALYLYNYFLTKHEHKNKLGEDWYYLNREGKRAPKGFKRIGGGSYRSAFLHVESGLVYKLGDFKSNKSEAANARKLRSKSPEGLPAELHIVETIALMLPSHTDYWGGVVRNNCSVQEYAANAKPTQCKRMSYYSDSERCTCRHEVCNFHMMEAIMRWSGLDDMHAYNFLWDGVKYWLIDIAM